MSVFAVLGESLGYRKCFKASFGFLFKEVSIVLNSKSKFTQLATECLSTKTWLFSENESHSVVSDSFASPWTVACQTPLFMEFSRQAYWSGLPFPSPRGLPGPRDWTCISYVSCIGRQDLYTSTTWETHYVPGLLQILFPPQRTKPSELGYKASWNLWNSI